ncbi:MAG: type II toxin-antitoxin system prevent-host-death family antitoxin [Acidobacteriota bacterium]
MPKIYSTYEAKARLSELLAHVRKGAAVTITHRGQPIAEVRPVERVEPSLSARIDELRRNGNIGPKGERRPLKTLSRKQGALRRFLHSRE